MALVDSFGRGIVNLRISVTDRCNLRCFYCIPHEEVEWLPRAEILSFEEIERFVRVVAALGIRKLRLTGGEPLLRKDLPKLVEKLVQAHPDWTEAEFAEALKREHGIEASAVTVGRVVRRLGYSVKKKRSSRASEIDQTSSDAERSGLPESEASPLRVWFLWTKRVRTRR